mgnify:CR=1 FL=1
MQVSEIIAKKRDGLELSESELEYLLKSYLDKDTKDYQMSAWLMAVYFKGLSEKELSIWTRLMWKSGLTFPRANRNTFWIDKHSTGGVGDKTSLVLVPLVHQLGEKLLGPGKLQIPMISGRGLGHSGGTLDKLDSIPGFSSQIPMKEALKLISERGFFMLGQTEEIAPADKQLYALRDVTATVESIPLIVSSIMSKKLAESPDGIVFDVKTGSGAFMTTEERAEQLASHLVRASKKENVDAVAVVSKMDEPLGWKVGNLLEIEECAEFLKGKQEPGLQEVVFELATQMVFLASKRTLKPESIREKCLEVSQSPETFKKFVEMFENQGGNWKSFESNAQKMRQELACFEFQAPDSGIFASCEAKSIGLLLIDLGGGRRTKEDIIDTRVGFEFLKKCGDEVARGETLVKVYYNPKTDLKSVQEKLTKAIQVSSGKEFQKQSLLVKNYL